MASTDTATEGRKTGKADPKKKATSAGFAPPKSAIAKEAVVRSGRSMKAPRSVAPPPEGSPPGAPGVQKKPHRFRPGTVALREIRRLQKSTDQLIPRKPFERLIREIKADFSADLKFKCAAVDALKEAAEDFVVNYFQRANLIAVKSKPPTVTLLPRHMQLAKDLKKFERGGESNN